jgi:formamidopyrimidine-DNA glycosylase
MPELPEVETLRAGLSQFIIGLSVKDTQILNPKSFINSESIPNYLIGSTITAVRRRAKVLKIELSSGFTVLAHLKMTGQLVYVGSSVFGAGHPNDSLMGKLPDRSTRVQIDFSDGSKLFFNDQRKFGWLRLIPTREVDNIDFMKKVGPEPLETSFNFDVFKNRISRRSGSNIKAVLLDQTVLAGIGNIYADEALWGAKIHPETRVKQLNDDQIKLLLKEIKYILNLSIEKGGSSNRNYVQADGKKGSFTDFARVFRREKLECPRCGDTIVKLRVAGRGTHICPSCQVNN